VLFVVSLQRTKPNETAD